MSTTQAAFAQMVRGEARATLFVSSLSPRLGRVQMARLLLTLGGPAHPDAVARRALVVDEWLEAARLVAGPCPCGRLGCESVRSVFDREAFLASCPAGIFREAGETAFTMLVAAENGDVAGGLTTFRALDDVAMASSVMALLLSLVTARVLSR